ncbi:MULTISPECIES: metallophosphoesterase [unclassified Eubacterium (in: firmicutes)]|jgi:hypothetical protein|uniref:metallophosphoesterase n=1 Tax=Eubacterium TaxID=1730 RepID=UPI000E517312|nr:MULTISPECIES: metallophosphoesterase [unclassified Eubacterium (in: firmicutes)]RGF49916.1 hypothetical protein DW006_08375 [Eubacterium sp. AF36-5BH]RHP21142.1 hypothetical protein DWZ69_06845 [Eubacterium sp. AF34-35BH]
MHVLVTGDVHGDILLLLEMVRSIENDEMLFVTGDFGLFWFDINSNSDKYTILNNMLESKNAYIVFVDGNHENHNFINRTEISEFCGAKCHKLLPRVIHIMRGEIVNIDGIKIFCFGGAYSVDRFWREKNKTYFEEELPNENEYDSGLNNLINADFKVDYIITHTCQRRLVKKLGQRHKAIEEIKLQNYIQWIVDNVEYKKHYFGHWHMDKKISESDIAIFNNIRNMHTDEVVGNFRRIM